MASSNLWELNQLPFLNLIPSIIKFLSIPFNLTSALMLPNLYLSPSLTINVIKKESLLRFNSAIDVSMFASTKPLLA